MRRPSVYRYALILLWIISVATHVHLGFDGHSYTSGFSMEPRSPEGAYPVREVVDGCVSTGIFTLILISALWPRSEKRIWGRCLIALPIFLLLSVPVAVTDLPASSLATGLWSILVSIFLIGAALTEALAPDAVGDHERAASSG